MFAGFFTPYISLSIQIFTLFSAPIFLVGTKSITIKYPYKMKKAYLFLLTFFFLVTLEGFSQSDTITITKKSGTTFRQNGIKLTPRHLLEITKYNAEAYQEMKIAKSNHDIGSVFGFTGGFLVGYPMGTALSGGKPNWVLAGVGAGLMLISIPFEVGYVKHAKNAVNLYNSGLKQIGQNKTDIKLQFTFNRVGLNLTF